MGACAHDSDGLNGNYSRQEVPFEEVATIAAFGLEAAVFPHFGFHFRPQFLFIWLRLRNLDFSGTTIFWFQSSARVHQLNLETVLSWGAGDHLLSPAERGEFQDRIFERARMSAEGSDLDGAIGSYILILEF